MEKLKTILLMLLLTGLFIFIGGLVDSQEGQSFALKMSLLTNLYCYFNCDKIVLKQYRATPLSIKENQKLYEMVCELSKRAEIKVPKIYIVPDKTPNAFATGRNPSHSSVAVTQGLLDILSPEELEGVLAHEISHIKHYDILTSSIAAVFVGAISSLLSNRRNNLNRNSNIKTSSNRRNNALLILIIPVLAMIIRMAISRSREYAADEGAANLTTHPEWLIEALMKLEQSSKQTTISNANYETAHMFIVNPLNNISFIANLLRTHPSTDSRISRLSNMLHNMK